MSKNDIYICGNEKICYFAGMPSHAFTPLMAGITYENSRYHVRRHNSMCYVFECVLDGAGYVELNGETVRLAAGDAYILFPCTYHNYYADPGKPWRKVWFNVQGDLVGHLMTDYQLEGNCLVQGGQ